MICRRGRSEPRTLLPLALVALLAACATPVGVTRVGQETVERQLTDTILTSNQPSTYSRIVLERLALTQEYATDPEAALAALHAGLGKPDTTARLQALAELAYAHARRTDSRSYYLAAALYAYAFLFPADPAAAPDRYDPRVPLAMDLYNFGLARGLSTTGGTWVDVRGRTVALPFGTLDMQLDLDSLRYGTYAFERFTGLSGYAVRGLRNRYRHPGLGAALAAEAVPIPGEAPDAEARWLPPRARVPVVLLLRVSDAQQSIATGNVRGTIEVHPWDEASTTAVGPYTVPLEFDPTATLALALEKSPLWDAEISGFRRGDFRLLAKQEETHGLFMTAPYKPGLTPVVFVHGTASSPARWAEMLNELMGDPVLERHYQWWFFLYDSGNPIFYSGASLRDALRSAVSTLDPAASDPALQKMVVIGHSQGGLLTKLMVVDSGDRFWRNVSDQPFESAAISPESRALAERMIFFHPLPCVHRVIFIATPHRGSFLAENFLGNIARKLVRVPSSLTRATMDLVRLDPIRAAQSAVTVPTSIDNMQWSNPGLQTLARSPIAPGVHAHSIIPVKGNGPAEDGNDGVVAYRSAHIDGVDSELVVRDSHSTQATQATIEEVRRILYEQLNPAAPSAGVSPH